MAFVYWIHLPEHTDLTSQGYIGFTSKTVEERFKKHSQDSLSTNFRSYTIHNAIRKYGVDNLKVTTLLEGSDEYCLFIESRLRPSENIGWNQAAGGIKPCGRKTTPTKEEKDRAVLKFKDTMSKLSPEDRARRSSNLRSSWYKNSEIHRLRLESMWEYNRGKPLTESHKSALSEVLKGRIITEEHKDKIRVSKLGIPRTLECREKISKTKLSANVKPWNHPACRLDVWIVAEEIYTTYVENNRCGYKKLGRILGLGTSLKSMISYFEAGWIPLDDHEFIEWKLQKQKEDECQSINY